MSYYEFWNVLCQWREEFTAREFASTFASPDPNKVLHDLCRKGLLARTSRGKYRVVSQQEHVRVSQDIAMAYDRVKSARLPYAFTGVDAVYMWTKGGYNVDRFFGFYPIHVKIRTSDLSMWKNFFLSTGCRVVVKGQPLAETLFGVFYVLHPSRELARDDVEGLSVEPLRNTVRFCKENPYAYEPALEMLDEMYHLGLGAKYRESSTHAG